LKLIEDVLSSPKSTSEILRMTKIPERTVRYNIAILRKRGVLREMSSVSDMRTRRFYIERDTT
jgi:hypothetical protein